MGLGDTKAAGITKELRDEFESVFPQLVKDLAEMEEYKDMEETNGWIGEVMRYNVPHGKRTRGLQTTLAYRYMVGDNITEEDANLSCVLGWLVEMLQAYLLVVDDIMDGSATRRGRPCWYKLGNIGCAGFNDAILIETSIFILLKKYFKGKPYYTDLFEILQDANHKTLYGQSLDTRTGIDKDLKTYTMERYTSIVKYKTSYYTFFLPIRLAMAMSGLNSKLLVNQVLELTLEVGHLFQVQDDFLDCFGDEEITGKVGTDIQDGKCSWLFVMANEKCTEEQRQLLWDNYGKDEKQNVEIVKKLYRDLGLVEDFKSYEDHSYKLICMRIHQMSEIIPKKLFLDMVNEVYKRNK